jgi:hypothetical protein
VCGEHQVKKEWRKVASENKQPIRDGFASLPGFSNPPLSYHLLDIVQICDFAVDILTMVVYRRQHVPTVAGDALEYLPLIM